MNAVNFLLETPFSSLSYNNQIAVKNLKRPTPELSLLSKQVTKGKEHVRKFKPETYQKYGWLCGCEVRNAFFCFPCLLFGGDDTWTKVGVTNLVHICPLSNKHEICPTHLQNVLKLSFLDKPNITMTIASDYGKTIQHHNEEVQKNRQVLNAMIDSMKFGATLQPVLKEYDTNGGMVQDLVEFSSASNVSVRDHMKKATIFKDPFRILQSELLDIMLEVYHERVALQLIRANYVSVMLEEVLDISDRVQIMVVFRYVIDDNVVERFWKFLNPSLRTGDVIYQAISDELAYVLSHPEKLIAQTYCGSVVLNGGPNQVPTRIKHEFTIARRIHCYSHTSYDIVSNASSSKSQCRSFFANMNSLCKFFVSAKLAEALDSALKRKHWPSAPPTSLKGKWEVNTRFVNVVFEYREDLIEILEKEVTETFKVHSKIFEADAYVRVLRDENFIFWLSVFQKLFPPVDTLLDQLLKETLFDKMAHSVTACLKKILTIRSEILEQPTVSEVDNADTAVKMEVLYHDVKEEDPDVGEAIHLSPPPKRSKTSVVSSNNRDAIQVCGLLASDVEHRFKFLGYMAASYILSPRYFDKFHTDFPDAYVKVVEHSYAELDPKQLRNELKALYDNVQLRQLKSEGCLFLLRIIVANGLAGSFEETTKLLQVVLTTPSQTSQRERCLYKSKDVKTFLRSMSSTVQEDKLNALAVLCCEKQFLGDIEGFNEKVIDMYATKGNRKKDFVYRQI